MNDRELFERAAFCFLMLCFVRASKEELRAAARQVISASIRAHGGLLT